MSSLTIRNVDEALKSSLRVRAAAHSRSMEEEARSILRQALMQELPKIGLGSRIAASFAEIGGVDLAIPARSLPRSRRN